MVRHRVLGRGVQDPEVMLPGRPVLRRDAPPGGSLEVLEETFVRRVLQALEGTLLQVWGVLEETLWTGLHKEYR